MSRYSKQLPGGGMVSWGYDAPMSEYFIQKYDKEDDLLFSISSYYTMMTHPKYPNKLQWSNGELLELIKEELEDIIPEEHVAMIGADLPF